MKKITIAMLVIGLLSLTFVSAIGIGNGCWNCCRADVNLDDQVTPDDYQVIKQHMGERECSMANLWCSLADTDRNGRVTTADYIVVKRCLI